MQRIIGRPITLEKRYVNNVDTVYDKNELLPGPDEDEHLRNEGEGPMFHGI